MTAELPSEPPAGLVAAQAIAVAAAEHAVATAEAGITEAELAALAESRARELGAVDFWTITNIGFGIGSLRCFPTEPPTDRRLWSPDVGHVDIHPVTADGWWGDCTRTIVVDELPEHVEMRERIGAVHAGLLSRVRPGMPASELYEWFFAECERYGVLALDRLHNIGHSLGEGRSYDLGYIDRHNPQPMWGAWAIEPFFGNHLYGVKLEDVVWFGSDRCTVLDGRSSTTH
jgi:Xaa-Pro aminopeptidase